MAKPPSPETTFVRQHATKSPKEIVALAKAAGLNIDEAKVGKVRDYDRAQAAKRSKKSNALKVKASPAAAPKPATSKPAATAKGVNKAAYVRGLGADITPTETLARAKKDGISLTLGYIYNLRKTAKRKGTKASPAKASPAKASPAKASPAPVKRGPGRPPKAASPAPSNSPVGGDEKALRSALAEFIVAKGLGAAKAIVEDVAEKIRRAVAG